MAEEDKNSSPLDEGTEIIAHTAQTAYATTAAVAAGGTAAEWQQEWQQEQPLQVLLEL